MTPPAAPFGEVDAEPQHIVFEGCDCIVMSPEDYDALKAAHAAARNDALEEAARVCDRLTCPDRYDLERVGGWRGSPGSEYYSEVALRIRALKAAR